MSCVPSDPAPESGDSTATTKNSGRSCPFCTARERALETALWDQAPELGSLLTPGVLATNLSYIPGERTVSIDLWSEWRQMLADLRLLGPVLTMTRNQAAAIGCTMRYPELEWSEDGQRAVDEEGEVDLDLRFWHHAAARHQRTESGHRLSAEFCDTSDHCFHRISVVSESSLDEFAAWVRGHQAIDRFANTAAPDESEIMETPRDPIGPGATIEVEASALDQLLRECVNQEVPLLAVVGAAGAVQGHRFLPQEFRADEDWDFCQSETVALYYRPTHFSRVTIHNLAPSGADCWSMKAYTADGNLALLLLPAASQRLPMWNLLVRAVAGAG